MSTVLQVLFVAASGPDADPVLGELRRSGFTPRCTLVGTVEDLRVALRADRWDVVIADQRLPGLGVPDTLTVVQRQAQDVPVIVVSDAMAPADVVAAMRAGAKDCLARGDLTRLAPVVEREVQAAAERLARKRAEEAQRSSEVSFLRLFADHPQPMWVFDRQTLRFLDVNEAAIAHYGYSREEFLALRISDIRPPEDVSRLLADVQEQRPAYRGTGRWRHRLKDGGIIDVEVAAHDLTAWTTGDAVLIIVFDITARLRAEEALRTSEERFRTMIEKSSEGIVLLDAEGRALYVSPSMQRMLGYEESYLLGGIARNTVHPDDQSRAANDFVDLSRRPGGDAHASYRLRHEDGSFRWFEMIGTNLLAEPAVGAMVLNMRDVTEQRQREMGRKHLAQIVASSDDAIISRTLDGTIESWNAGAARLYGYAAEEAIGQPISMLTPPDHTDEVMVLLEKLVERRGVMSYETMHRRKDGAEIDVAVTLSPIRDEAGAIVGASSIARDIGERKRALQEAQRARAAAEELAQMRNDFVAAVSHELRTPLTAVIGYSDLLRTRWDVLDETRRLAWLDRVIAAGNRQKHLVEDLLLLTNIESGAFAVVCDAIPLRPPIVRAVEELRGAYPDQRIELVGQDDLIAHADPERVVEILAHLLDNAAKYSPEGSTIAVSWRADGASIIVRVRDDGCGIPEVGSERLFTRFGRVPGSRMRAGRVGTGLGLYLSRLLARAMGGNLDLETTGPTGSTFRLTLQHAGVRA